eukprot:CAMPEP_0198424572 /NCGR_PEP_ID=MMETSP1452-20131203/3932_1 /TAXON_ID=1181717 /ORGANISM="Synchroma pusillum, Strain CCMP3072" /LENGTH=220 /DNA_ID=CAMNT_0044144917 /DNA_START=42 /DNA_END=704 /DNA_ORIENTATION=-
MMRALAITLALAAPALAFRGRSAGTASSTSLGMAKKAAVPYVETLPGAVPPLGFWDPNKLSEGASDETVKRYREAELKHGRLAMVGALGALWGENFHPIFSSADGPAALQIYTVPVPAIWAYIFMIIGWVEGGNIEKGWKTPAEATPEERAAGYTSLKDDWVPGDLGFDPLGLKPTDDDEWVAMQNRELNNGRLAMLSVMGILAQEAVDKKSVFEHLSGK